MVRGKASWIWLELWHHIYKVWKDINQHCRNRWRHPYVLIVTIYSLDILLSHPVLNQSIVPCPVLTVASWPAYRFLKRQVRWSVIPISFRIFHSFVIHTVKGFVIVIKAEIDVFWNSLAFSMIQQMLAIWSLVPLPFLKPAWTSGSSQFTYCWSLAWRILSIILLACEMSAIMRKFEHSLALPFFGIGIASRPFG